MLENKFFIDTGKSKPNRVFVSRLVPMVTAVNSPALFRPQQGADSNI